MREEIFNDDQQLFNDIQRNGLLFRPTDEMVEDITPWRSKMRWTFLGILLFAFAPWVDALAQLMTAAGVVLMYLGLRSVRNECKWLTAAYRIVLGFLVWGFFRFALGSTIWHTMFWNSVVGVILSWLQNLAVLTLLFCIYQAIRFIQRRNDAYEDAGYILMAMAMFALCVLAGVFPHHEYLEFGTWVAMALCAWSLFKAYKRMGEAGYGMQPLPVKLNAWVIWVIALGTCLCCMTAGVLWGQQYPMDWQPDQPVTRGAEKVRQELIALGVPEKVAADLSQEDLLQLRGVESAEVEKYISKGEPVKITRVTLQLPTGVKNLQHFQWLTAQAYRGTEMFCMSYNTKNTLSNPHISASFLYSQNGQTVRSEPFFDGVQTYGRFTLSSFGFCGTCNDFLGGAEISYVHNHRTMVAFSFPHGSENCSGYILFDTNEEQARYVTASYFAQYSPVFSTYLLDVMEYYKVLGVDYNDPYFKSY